jgi:hypothetical protein
LAWIQECCDAARPGRPIANRTAAGPGASWGGKIPKQINGLRHSGGFWIAGTVLALSLASFNQRPWTRNTRRRQDMALHTHMKSGGLIGGIVAADLA